MYDVEPVVLPESEIGAGVGWGCIFCGEYLPFFFLSFLAGPHGMQDLGSLTRDQTYAPFCGSVES